MRTLIDAVHLILLGYGALFVVIAAAGLGGRGIVALVILSALIWMFMSTGRWVAGLVRRGGRRA